MHLQLAWDPPADEFEQQKLPSGADSVHEFHQAHSEEDSTMLEVVRQSTSPFLPQSSTQESTFLYRQFHQKCKVWHRNGE